MAKHIIEGGKLYAVNGDERRLLLRIPTAPGQRTGWRDWLGDPKNRRFTFIGTNGRFTCRKEKRISPKTGAELFYWYCDNGKQPGQRRRRSFPANPVNDGPPMLARLEKIASELNRVTLADGITGPDAETLSEIPRRRDKQRRIGRQAATAPGPGPKRKRRGIVRGSGSPPGSSRERIVQPSLFETAEQTNQSNQSSYYSQE